MSDVVSQLQLQFFREYDILMDEVYTVCEDWGEGSGLQFWDTDCNEANPGEKNNRPFRLIIQFSVKQALQRFCLAAQINILQIVFIVV